MIAANSPRGVRQRGPDGGALALVVLVLVQPDAPVPVAAPGGSRGCRRSSRRRRRSARTRSAARSRAPPRSPLRRARARCRRASGSKACTAGMKTCRDGFRRRGAARRAGRGRARGPAGAARDARGEGFALEELAAAVAEDRLALLPLERVLGGRYTAAEIEQRERRPGRAAGPLPPAARAARAGPRRPRVLRRRHRRRTLDQAVPRVRVRARKRSSRSRACSASGWRVSPATTTAAFVDAFLEPGDSEARRRAAVRSARRAADAGDRSGARRRRTGRICARASAAG